MKAQDPEKTVARAALPLSPVISSIWYTDFGRNFEGVKNFCASKFTSFKLIRVYRRDAVPAVFRVEKK